MKYLSILMLIIFILSLFGMAYLYLTANISVKGTGILLTEASTQPEYFETLCEQIRDDAVIGTAFSKTVPDDINNYQFCTFRVQLKNSTLLDAEMVQLQVTPRDGDVLQIGNATPQTLKAGETAVFEVTVLTGSNTYAGHEITVSYYLWGQPFTMRAVCNSD